ncbi:cytochrome P450 [Aspergillus pseudonomiae]|uniref:Cytochrome P450 n=1 Tax=Aspergillus pseudonomiae TaxID=1506151 RepID=A0A5N7DLL1_9EURO|nr:cytochrome P450 [Aspergillus pseudonomiae]KAB8265005.1 cytochrome P450 [Aspergillus pseudonomiae]KAE8407337.1 cytochrome P450 [Aspergillus pseudonomiae]
MIVDLFLMGKDPNQASLKIDIDRVDDLDTLKVKVASRFNIVVPNSIDFQDQAGRQLLDIEDVLDCPEAVGILVDGHSVREPSGPKGLPFAGAYYEVFPDHVGNHERMFHRFGGVIKYTTYGRDNYLTRDPRVAEVAFAESPFFTKATSNPNHPLHPISNQNSLFICDTNENWRIAHRFIAPALNPKAIRHYHPILQSVVESSFPVFDELDEQGEAFNTYQYMMKLASGAIGQCALGMNLHHFDSIDAPVHDLVTSIQKTLQLNKKVASKGDWYAKVPFGDPKELDRTQKHVVQLLNDAFDTCPKSGDEDLPINEAALRAACIFDYLNRAVDDAGQKLPRELVAPNMLPVVGAGFVTTACLLSWLIYSLCTYEGTQDRLLQELVDHGVTHNTTWDPDFADSLPYLNKFIKETQRLHNPSFQPGRVAKVDCVVPGGYQLPKGAALIIALYAIHSNPDIWDNPHRFDPDRWDHFNPKDKPKCSYIPFGTGPRSCIGFNFALGEVKVVLPSLVYRYEFVREGENSIEYDPQYQLIRPMNLYIRAKKRTHWPKPSAAPA